MLNIIRWVKWRTEFAGPENNGPNLRPGKRKTKSFACIYYICQPWDLVRHFPGPVFSRSHAFPVAPVKLITPKKTRRTYTPPGELKLLQITSTTATFVAVVDSRTSIPFLFARCRYLSIFGILLVTAARSGVCRYGRLFYFARVYLFFLFNA